MNRLRNSFIVVKMNAAIFHVVPREESTPLILLVRPAPLLCPRQKSNLDPRFRPAPSLCCNYTLCTNLFREELKWTRQGETIDWGYGFALPRLISRPQEIRYEKKSSVFS